LVQNQFNKQVKVVRTDNGTEFNSEPMKVFYREKGIMHQTIAWIPLNKIDMLSESIGIY